MTSTELAPPACRPSILLTGATGYIGGRLLTKLLEKGHPVRCLCRDPEKLKGESGSSFEAVKGDVLDPSSLSDAMAGMDVAYYLIHSMGAGSQFADLDRRAAQHFGQAAREAGVGRIVYLGGLGDESLDLSEHLRSRQEAGALLRASGVPVTELRASIVIGSGSLSFEMIRALVERLPLMVTPRWVEVPAQPIAISDLLSYLVEVLDQKMEGNPIYEIGGADRISYGGLMQEYARLRGLRRGMLRVPLLTPRLSSLWLGLVTPLYARVGRLLIDGIRYPTVVRDTTSLSVFSIKPKSVREALVEALEEEDLLFARSKVVSRLDEERSLRPSRGLAGLRIGNRIFDSRMRVSSMAPDKAFLPIQRIGGRRGWYYGHWLWKLRGLMDQVVGGVGLRRGRRDAEQLEVGDALDWWRVEQIEPGRRLRLYAEMKTPGRAWLDFEIVPCAEGSRVYQTAIFDPRGLFGLLYWCLLYPVHFLVFNGMLKEIVRRGEADGADS